MQVVRLLVDDSFGESLGLAEETASILLVSDDDSVEDGEDEGSDTEGHGEGGEARVGKEAIFDADDEAIRAKVVRNAASGDHVRRLNRLTVHEGLQAGEEDEAGALTGQNGDGTEHHGRIVLDLGMLRRDHESGHHLAEHDANAAKNGTFLGREILKEETRQDSKERKRVQHEVEPVEDFVIDLVLFLDEVEVAGREKRGKVMRKGGDVPTWPGRKLNLPANRRRLQLGTAVA